MTNEPQTRAFDPEEERGGAAAAAVMWGCLSRALLRPTRELAADVLGGGFLQALESVADAGSSESMARSLGEISSLANPDGDAEAFRLELEIEYNRLFVGPFKVIAPPYESYYASAGEDGEGGRLRTQDEFNVRAAYRGAGYAMPDEFIDLPDHAAVELEFLALLARDEVAAWEAGDDGRALGLQQSADDFAAAHPCRWFADLAKRVADGARLPFYPAVLRIACLLLGV